MGVVKHEGVNESLLSPTAMEEGRIFNNSEVQR